MTCLHMYISTVYSALVPSFSFSVIKIVFELRGIKTRQNFLVTLEPWRAPAVRGKLSCSWSIVRCTWHRLVPRLSPCTNYFSGLQATESWAELGTRLKWLNIHISSIFELWWLCTRIETVLRMFVYQLLWHLAGHLASQLGPVSGLAVPHRREGAIGPLWHQFLGQAGYLVTVLK